MTFERSIIRLIHPTASSPAIEPYLEISWFARHPGDAVESTLLEFINQKRQEISNNFSLFIPIEKELVYIYWNQKLAAGTAILLDILAISLWSQYIWKIHTFNPKTWDDLFNEYQTIEVEELEPSNDRIINPDWLKSSLEGKTVEIHSKTKEEFITGIIQFFETFPWTVYLLQSGLIENNLTKLKFQTGEISPDLPYEEIFFRLAGEPHDEFWKLITKSIIKMAQLPLNQRLEAIRKSLNIIHIVTGEDIDITKKLTVIKTYLVSLLDMDVEFTIQYVNQTLFDASTLPPDFALGRSFLDIADMLLQENMIDLGKLAEGTALQIAISLESTKEKEEIILDLAKRSEYWGEEHLIGFIQSIAGLLADEEEDKKLLTKIISKNTELLKTSWDGLLCLVEAYLTIGETMKAIALRFDAAAQIVDQFMQAEDIFAAFVWSINLPNLQEQEFANLYISKIEKAITQFPIGEILQSQIRKLVKSFFEQDRILIFEKFLDWIKTKLLIIGVSDRIPILKMLDEVIKPKVSLLNSRVEVLLLLFSQLLQEDKHNNFDDADNLLRSIYNIIDPSTPNYIDIISYITKSLIISAGENDEWEFVEEANKRFTLMVNDDEISRKAIMDSYFAGAEARKALDSSEFVKDDIGLKLYNEAINLAYIENDAEQVLSFLPNAKKMALKTQSFEAYANFSIIEARLNRISELPWIDTTTQSARKLLQKGVLQGANYIFSEVSQMDLSPEEEYDLLSQELSLVEIEPDLINANEIFEKRNRLISISTASDNIADTTEIIEHYRNGISELISKGDAIFLNNLLLDAIVFSHKKSLSIVSEFNNILLDSFLSNITSYQRTKNDQVYFELQKTFRQIIQTFQSTNIDLAIKLATHLIQTNLELAKESIDGMYLKRALLISNEIGYAIAIARGEEIPIPVEEKLELIESFEKLVNQIISKNRIFGYIDAVLRSTLFYQNLEEVERFYLLLDNALGNLKKSAVKTKALTSNLLVGIVLLSEIFILLDGQFSDEICTELQIRAIKILNVISTFKLSPELEKSFNTLRRKINDSSRQAFEEFPFSLETYLKGLDMQY
ncbi:MAG: hypothetical protein ACXAD7_00320 [Candidatus Kariarchaeaceae archaeon]